MLFNLYMECEGIPDGSMDVSNDYYMTEDDYINALKRENIDFGFDALTSGGDDKLDSYINYTSKINGYSPKNTGGKKYYAKSDCTLYSPDGNMQEDVDSIIDKFVSQREYLVLVKFNMSSMEGEFEEELRMWNDETRNILTLGKDMGNDWIEEHIPRRDLKLNFLNKSNKEVSFKLTDCEIEKKLGENQFILYVNKMVILK